MFQTAETESAGAQHIGRLATDWYGGLVGAERLSVRTESTVWTVASALRIFRQSGRATSIVTTEGSLRPRGLAVLALLLAATRRRKLVVLGFLPGTKFGLTGRAIDAIYRLTLSRVCLGVQVMTAQEKETYAVKYRLPRRLIRHIPFYFMDDRLPIEPVAPELRHGILASGRNSCDWSTLLEAARGQAWPLTIVCSEADRSAILNRAEAENIRVIAEIPRAEHNQMLAEAQLFLVVVKDRGASSGHVRLASAAVRLTPTVISFIPGVSGYEHLAVATVPAEQPEVLRETVNALLKDGASLASEAVRIFELAQQRPFSRYAAEIREFVDYCESPAAAAA